MYINNKELSDLQRAVSKLQDMIDEFDTQHPEGLFNARELANDCEEHIKRVENREVKQRARKIIKKRVLANES